MYGRPVGAQIFGSVVTAGLAAFISISSAWSAPQKVTICHVPPGDPGNPQEIVIGVSALLAHLQNHPGDSVGPCRRPPECMIDDQCNDANPCTVDRCTPGGCDYSMPVSCADGNSCTTDVCIPDQGGCVAIPSGEGSECDDGNACTGSDRCSAAGECLGNPLSGCCNADSDCSDGAGLCTTDRCADHSCVHEDIVCPAGEPCTVAGCDPATGCFVAPLTCPDDRDICTVEKCDPRIGVSGTCVSDLRSPPPEQPEVSCADGLDNDCDGSVDAQDSDCSRVSCPCAETWNNGIGAPSLETVDMTGARCHDWVTADGNQYTMTCAIDRFGSSLTCSDLACPTCVPDNSNFPDRCFSNDEERACQELMETLGADSCLQ